MAKKDRRYEIIEDLTGGPPTFHPVLGENGKVIPASQKLKFNKQID